MEDYEDTGENTELSDDGGAERQNDGMGEKESVCITECPGDVETESMDGGTEWAGGAMANKDYSKDEMEDYEDTCENMELSDDGGAERQNDGIGEKESVCITECPSDVEMESMHGGTEWAGGAMANKDYSKDDQIGLNQENDVESNQQDGIQQTREETSPFCNDDQIGSINNAEGSPELKKRFIRLRPGLPANIIGCRDQKPSNSPYSPSGRPLQKKKEKKKQN